MYGWDEDEPCWGDVSVVGEVLNYEGDYEWIHACEGHYDVLSQDENKQYVKEATVVQITA